jgi:hypothetical protein
MFAKKMEIFSDQTLIRQQLVVEMSEESPGNKLVASQLFDRMKKNDAREESVLSKGLSDI